MMGLVMLMMLVLSLLIEGEGEGEGAGVPRDLSVQGRHHQWQWGSICGWMNDT